MRLLFRSFVLSFTLLLGVALTCGGLVHSAEAKEPAKDPAKEQTKDAPNKFDALKRFSQVLDLVERYYVRDVSQGDLINGAVKGMLQGLDPHSTFMNTDEYKEMQETTSGEFFGVGIEISQEKIGRAHD